MVSQCGRRERIPRIDHVAEVLGTGHAEGLSPFRSTSRFATSSTCARSPEGDDAEKILARIFGFGDHSAQAFGLNRLAGRTWTT